MKHCAGILGVIALSVLLVNAQTDPNYRLNSVVRPSAYVVKIAPYFDSNDDRAFTFDGEVSITIRTAEQNVNSIKLHSEDLVFTADNITLVQGATNLPLAASNALEFDTKYTFATINLAAPLEANVDYELIISYTGPVRADLNGFYRSYYFENGQKKWLGATQMQPTHARKTFPCFDEPEYKATFAIVVERTAEYKTVLANGKLEKTETLTNGLIRDTFLPSPRMSSYLVAILVSEFEGVTNSKPDRSVGVYGRPEAINQSDYALNIGEKIVESLGEYLRVDYYRAGSNLKLDHVALPDFRAGAMENWGLLKYRESLLLFDPEDSTPYYKYRVAQIVAHETTHMWFGDLVTCHWWSNTWLNEGFANYFENYIVERVDPELRAGDIIVTGGVYSAYQADDNPNSAALTNENVNSPAEISGHFGTISYQKGGSIIRMIHNLLGDETFRSGLNSYLQTNEFGMGTPTLMYEALEKGINLSNVFANSYPGHTITEIMSSWISKPGFPVLKVTVDHKNRKIDLEQSRFYGKAEFAATDELYHIPLTYTTEMGNDFNNVKPTYIMDTKTHTLENVANLEENNWVIFNLQETGFYRVNYDENSWKLIARGLKGDTREQVHYLNRAKIVNDLFAFLNADVVNFATVKEVLDFLANELEYTVWLPAISGLNSLRNKYMYDTEAVATLDGYILNLLSHAISELGYEVAADEPFITTRNRMQILEFACKLSHQGCIDFSIAAFKDFKDNGKAVTPSLRPLVYCNALRHGSDSDYDLLWDKMLKANVVNDGLVIQSALGCTKSEDRLQLFLGSVLLEESPIRSQDITAPLSSVLSDHSNVEIALNFVKANYEALNKVYTSMDGILTYFPPALHTDQQFEEFESWLDTCTECSSSATEAAKNSLKNARSTATWAKEHDIIEQLKGSASITGPSLLVALLAVVTVLFLRT